MSTTNEPLLKFLQKQFHTTYDLTEWFVSFRDAVKDLTEVQAREKVTYSLPTIFEIVNHLTYWNERYLKKIRNEHLEKGVTDNDLTFTQSDLPDWDSLCKKADAVFANWVTELESPTNPEALDFGALGNIVTHNAYHIGQIVFIRKLQKSWDPGQGVK